LKSVSCSFSNVSSPAWTDSDGSSKTSKYRTGSPSADESTGLRRINLDSSTLAVPDRLLLQTPTGFVDAPSNAALAAKTACDSVVAGDFDNDMDMDVYLLCRGQVQR
jgi:hypothetical protein